MALDREIEAPKEVDYKFTVMNPANGYYEYVIGVGSAKGLAQAIEMLMVEKRYIILKMVMLVKGEEVKLESKPE